MQHEDGSNNDPQDLEQDNFDSVFKVNVMRSISVFHKRNMKMDPAMIHQIWNKTI